MDDLSRRDTLKMLTAGMAGISLAGGTLEAQEKSPIPAFRGQHKPKPLGFDPAKLTGLSEKLSRSHWENNYGGAVRALNALEQRLDAMMARRLAACLMPSSNGSAATTPGLRNSIGPLCR